MSKKWGAELEKFLSSGPVQIEGETFETVRHSEAAGWKFSFIGRCFFRDGKVITDFKIGAD